MSRKIEGIDKAEQVIGRWEPSDLCLIESIKLLSEPDCCDSNLEVIALFQKRADSWPNFDKEMFRVVISFTDVSNLSLKEFGSGGVQIMGFDIRYIGDRGLEGINYEIDDYEDNRICFNCRSINIHSVSTG